MYRLSCIFTVICALVLHVSAAIALCVRKKQNWNPILLGALTFVFFQVFMRLPIIQILLPKYSWYIVMSSAQPVLYALFLGSTAALFENGGRYLVMSLFLKTQRNAADGIAFGIGHGGIEAILLAGIKGVAMLISPVEFDVPGIIAASGVERLSAMLFQIALSVMVMKSVREKKIIWLIAAFTLHTLVDFAVVLAAQSVNVWVLEAVLFIFSGCMGWFALNQYRKEIIPLT
ncbi:MAG: YhfC family intramembrane metalloprotease [Clostridiales bacterium]|nr:YhfC family intramembrane metalloprotease [Clostridiales bacterium]